MLEDLERVSIESIDERGCIESSSSLGDGKSKPDKLTPGLDSLLSDRACFRFGGGGGFLVACGCGTMV